MSRARPLLFFIISMSIIVLGQMDPGVSWIFGAISFIIPLTILLNIMVLLYFLVKRDIVLLYSLMVIIFTSNYIFATFNFKFLFSSGHDTGQNSLSILSHNVKGNLDYFSSVTDEYFKEIPFQKFDIICLQEFRKSNVDSTIADFLVQGDISSYEHFFSGSRMTPANLGLLILSKYPIVNRGKILFGENSFNGVNYVDVKIKKDTLRVYNFHFKSYNLAQATSLKHAYYIIRDAIPERSIRMEEVIEHIAKSPYPLLFAGDLNESQFSYIYHEVSNYMMDSFSGGNIFFGRTFYLLPLRIDYIFVDEYFRVNSFEISSKRYFSDHFPIWARLSYR